MAAPGLDIIRLKKFPCVNIPGLHQSWKSGVALRAGGNRFEVVPFGADPLVSIFKRPFGPRFDIGEPLALRFSGVLFDD